MIRGYFRMIFRLLCEEWVLKKFRRGDRDWEYSELFRLNMVVV